MSTYSMAKIVALTGVKAHALHNGETRYSFWLQKEPIQIFMGEKRVTYLSHPNDLIIKLKEQG